MSEVQAERRREPRQRTLLSASALHGDGLSSQDCMIRSLSAHGARVSGAEAGWLPRRFDLVARERGLRRAAEVVWRAGDAAGVRFTDEAPADAAMAEIERLREEKRRLVNRLRDLTS